VRSTIGLRSTAETIAALIRETPIPAAVDDAVDRAASELAGGTLIVRSSAVGEDSDGASFAGQLDSIADVSGRSFLLQALREVWASRWSARVLAYQLTRGVRLAGMGVIVQQQIASRVSGVLFTLDPARQDRMLLEYCAGMGDALVSGRENPGRVTIDRRGLRWTPCARPGNARDGEALLTDAALATLGRAGLEIERLFGAPQDIEWTLDADNRVWIVQARPITVPFPRAAAPDVDSVHWSNANVNENFPSPISPLLYSIARVGYYHYFRNLGRAFGISRWRLRAMDQPLRSIIGVHGGRMYYNLTSIHGVLRSAPFGELLTGSFNQFVGADETSSPAAAGRFRATGRFVTQAIEAGVIALKTAWQYAFLTRRVARFEATVSRFAERTHPSDLQDRPLRLLVEDLRGFIEIRNHKWKDAALADAASMVCYGVLQRLLARALPSRDQDQLQNNLLKALPGLVSSVPAVELWNLSRMVRSNARLREAFESPSDAVLRQIGTDPAFADFRTALDRYLDEWGFRCSGELMLTVPSAQEEPSQAIDLVRAYAALDAESPADQLVRQEEERHRETAAVAAELRGQRFFSRVPLLRTWHIASIVLRWTQRSILLRERARLKQALLYSRLRHVALAIGRRLVACGHVERADDVFFLTAEEAEMLASGTAMFPDTVRELVALRRSEHDVFLRTPPPDAITLGWGEYWEPRPAAHGSRLDADDQKRLAAPELFGLGACGGVTTARAAILADVSEAHRLVPGDVLVTKQTDPGWGPVFPLVSGLVIERGGMLSHGAIIAREFGIPSVVGVAHATTLIRDGSRIQVDGNRGMVRLVDRNHEGEV
jgi:pyruvate,water dikinase